MVIGDDQSLSRSLSLTRGNNQIVPVLEGRGGGRGGVSGAAGVRFSANAELADVIFPFRELFH